MTDGLRVNEIFGPTVQGEGPSIGKPAVFLRLAGCNLDCGAGAGATWACDTPYSWDWKGVLGTVYDRESESHATDLPGVIEDIGRHVAPLLVVTGGEPMLQQKGIAALALRLADARVGVERIEVETNGTIAPSADLIRVRSRMAVGFIVSPKLAGSGVAREKAWKPEAIEQLIDPGGARWKFVVSNQDDLDELEQFIGRFGLDPRRVWAMPAGVSADAVDGVLEELADSLVALGVNVTSRLQVVMWRGRRGH